MHEQQLERIELALMLIIQRQEIQMATDADLLAAIAQIDAATTDIALKVDAEGGAITDLSADVTKLRDELAQSGASQTTVDRLTSLASRLAASGAAIASHTLNLRAMAQDPANPTPVVSPSTATVAPTPTETPAPVVSEPDAHT